MDDADEDLTRLAIRQAFEAEDQYTETVAGDDDERVAMLRRLGRSVARELGWKVSTGSVQLDDGSVRVHLVITASTPLRDQAMERRRARKMREAIMRLPGSH